MNRAEKIALLSKVLQGELSELKVRKGRQGRLWTCAERHEQAEYLKALCPNNDAEFIESARQSWFGNYDITNVFFGGTLHCLELPNGWKVYRRPPSQ